jgi:hypothetical protein
MDRRSFFAKFVAVVGGIVASRFALEKPTPAIPPTHLRIPQSLLSLQRELQGYGYEDVTKVGDQYVVFENNKGLDTDARWLPGEVRLINTEATRRLYHLWRDST